jgi:signal transduction histidine kinase
MQEINLQEIQQILASVRQALNRIENQEYLAGQPFEVLLEELRELWEGTAEITWAISSNAQSELDSDLGLARCCFEVIRESVTNAVKHGSANDIAISIDRTHNLLLLQIVNNGSVTNIQQGSLGSELMDQLCLARTLVEIEGRVSLNAELALNPEAALQSLAS